MANHSPEFTQNRKSASVGNLHELAANLPGRFEGLDYEKSQVLLLASHGGTVEEVAEALEVGKPYVEKARDYLVEAFEVPNMAAVVGATICRRILPYEENKDQSVTERLTPRELQALKLFGEGYSNRQIATQLGKTTSVFARNICSRIFTKLEASGRTHSVRKSYEVGIFQPLD